MIRLATFPAKAGLFAIGFGVALAADVLTIAADALARGGRPDLAVSRG